MEKESVSSQEQEEFNSEEEYDEESGSGDELGNGQMREVDAGNVLNYQTDSSDEDDEGSDDLAANLEQQKQEL